MLVSFHIKILGESVCSEHYINAILVFIGFLRDRHFIVQSSSLSAIPTKPGCHTYYAIVFELVAIGRCGCEDGLSIVHDAMKVMPEQPGGVYHRMYEITWSFDVSHGLHGWTIERQNIALAALFHHFDHDTQKDIRTKLGGEVSEGWIHKHRTAVFTGTYPGKLRNGVIIRILNALLTLQPPVPPHLIDKFRIMVEGDGDSEG